MVTISACRRTSIIPSNTYWSIFTHLEIILVYHLIFEFRCQSTMQIAPKFLDPPQQRIEFFANDLDATFDQAAARTCLSASRRMVSAEKIPNKGRGV